MTATQPAPTVPDEAKRAAREKWSETETWPATTSERWGFVLTAAAPFIVAANQPEVDGDLRRQLCERAHEACGGACDGGCAEVAQGLLPFIQAYVAAQVTAARAEDSRG